MITPLEVAPIVLSRPRAHADISFLKKSFAAEASHTGKILKFNHAIILAQCS